VVCSFFWRSQPFPIFNWECSDLLVPRVPSFSLDFLFESLQAQKCLVRVRLSEGARRIYVLRADRIEFYLWGSKFGPAFYEHWFSCFRVPFAHSALTLRAGVLRRRSPSLLAQLSGLELLSLDLSPPTLPWSTSSLCTRLCFRPFL